jgi:large subunit ribosomal protein L29
MVKKKELKNMSKEDLNRNLVELRKELLKFNSQIATGTIPKNPGQIKNAKKTVARILTILNQKKEGGQNK